MAKIGVEWINDFPPPCDQNELSYCDETSVGFLNGMVSRGHTAQFNWGKGNAFERDFRDPAFGGDDTNWVDAVDFAAFFVARVDECLKRLQRILRRQGR